MEKEEIIGLESLMKVDPFSKSKMQAKLEALHRLIVEYHYHVTLNSKYDGLVTFNDGTDVFAFLCSLKLNRLSMKRMNDIDERRISEIKEALQRYKDGEYGWKKMLHCLDLMKTFQDLSLLEQWNNLNRWERSSLSVLADCPPFQDANKEYVRCYLVEWFIQMREQKFLDYTKEYFEYVKTNHANPQLYDTPVQKIAYFSDGKKMNSLGRELQAGKLTRYFTGVNQELRQMVLAYWKVLSNRIKVNTNDYLIEFLASIEKYQTSSLFYQEKEQIQRLITFPETKEKRLMVLELLDQASETYICRENSKNKTLVK